MPHRCIRVFLYANLLSCIALPISHAQNQAVYTDSLQSGWEGWGWANVNYANTSPVHAGSRSVSVTIVDNTWQAIYMHHSPFNSSSYENLTFWIHGGPNGGQQLKVVGHAGDAVQLSTNLPPLPANTWQQHSIPLANLGLANRADVDGIWIQDAVGAPQPTFYLDDIYLMTNSVTSPTITFTSPVTQSTYAAPATIFLSATVVPRGQTILKVQFYNGSNLLNEDAITPYEFAWAGVGVGTYSLFARVVYGSGQTVESSSATVTVASVNPTTITIDAQLDRRPISPLIYGVAFATTSELDGLNATLNRSGGNAETRYNWQIDAHNRGSDWYFLSIGDDPGVAGGSADTFVTASRSGGAEPMLTIPMIGWAPKLGANRAKLPSYSVAKYGPQAATEPGWPDIGNGVGTNPVTHTSWLITTNDPMDANFPTNSNFQLAWLQHLTNRWGVSTNGGVRYYFMDNEHSIWHATHRDVHPTGASRPEIRDRFFDYASKVKAVDPNAIVLGPEEFGWSGYFHSGADLQYGGTYGWGYLPDRATNGGMDYVAWLLSEFHKRHTNTNQRLLDYFTLHRYTEDGAVGGDDVSAATQLKRNRWTRSFWDTNYVDESWIGSQVENKVMLIPRMKAWVDRYYPGTKIGITEYNWGAQNHINGATTQADILGIFGREGVDLATRWTTPPSSTPTFKAMKMFRNYDGNKSCFGDLSIRASGPNPDAVSPYAAVRSADGALTLLVINKQLSAGAAMVVALANFAPAGHTEVWQLDSANSIVRLPNVSFPGNTFTSTVPAQSITLFIVPPTTVAGPPANPNPVNGASSVSTNVTLTWTPGLNATGHLLYFGVSSNSVANATTASAEYKGSLAAASYSPAGLASSGRFFWRVDEVAGTNITPGPVWTFSTIVDPTSGVSASCVRAGEDTFLVSFPTKSGQAYQIERSNSLNPPDWEPAGSEIAGTGAPASFPDTPAPGGNERYYRVLILPP